MNAIALGRRRGAANVIHASQSAEPPEIRTVASVDAVCGGKVACIDRIDVGPNYLLGGRARTGHWDAGARGGPQGSRRPRRRVMTSPTTASLSRHRPAPPVPVSASVA